MSRGHSEAGSSSHKAGLHHYIPQSPTISSTSNPSSIHTASLIQSAARSILDNSTPSTGVSDDESCADGRTGCARLASSPCLASLQMKMLPPMPDEQDRKRFIGCLAAVLASSYDYDVTDDDSLAESYAYLDLNDDDDDDDDDYLHDELLHTESASFEYSDFSDTGESGHASLERSASAPLPSRGTSRQQQSRARRRTHFVRNRHKKRRYDVLSRLLLSSAELLKLDKSQARGFLPMLDQLMVRHNQTTSRSKKQSSSPNVSYGYQDRDTSVPFASQEWNLGTEPDFIPPELDEDSLRPFLESLTPGAGFRCLSLLLLQHLLNSEEGYDARVRHVIKKLGVLVLVHDMKYDPVDPSNEIQGPPGLVYNELVMRATRKFESLEHCIASKLIQLSMEQDSQVRRKTQSNTDVDSTPGISRDQLIRGLKIGSAGVVAGTLFAVTGGLAAPSIAAGLAAITGGAAATAAVVTLTSTAAVTAIFGVGGGSLAAYKMQRRTQGLTEFEFQKESREVRPNRDATAPLEAQLFSTICISGWLRDKYDFQRPWGVHPSTPKLRDKQELLERFYSVYRPDLVPKCSTILSRWQGEEKVLWNVLRQKYGRSPDSLFPFESGPKFSYSLTHEQKEVLHQLFVELGYAPSQKEETHEPSPIEKMRTGLKQRFGKHEWKEEARLNMTPGTVGLTSFSTSFQGRDSFDLTDGASAASSGVENGSLAGETNYKPPKHLSTVWDYQANFGGELYTVKWETSMLTELCDSVADLAIDVVSGATRHILKQTALSSLISAFAWPYALVNAANMIDGTWTLAIERSDEAGKELARSLLFSRAGHRPVTLVGFSFGGRAIYSCLKELARYQSKWEDYHEKKEQRAESGIKSYANGELADDFFDFMREPASIVEDAIIMGIPNHLSLSSWSACRQVVAGRLVNCYSRKDLILSLMFQYKRLSGGLKPVCGTCPVNVPGVENVDVSDLINGHQDYCLLMRDILKRVRHGQPLRTSSSTNEGLDDDEALDSERRKLSFD